MEIAAVFPSCPLIAIGKAVTRDKFIGNCSVPGGPRTDREADSVGVARFDETNTRIA